MDLVERRIASTADQVFVVTRELENWKPNSGDHKQEKQTFEEYSHLFSSIRASILTQVSSTLHEQLDQLSKVKAQSIGRQVAVSEDNKKQIAEIFERVNDARVRFQV